MIITQNNSNNSRTHEFKWTSFEERNNLDELIKIPTITKKDLRPKFRLGLKIWTQDKHNPESASKITAEPWSTVFSKAANPLNLLQKSGIHAIFKAKFVHSKTYSPPSYSFTDFTAAKLFHQIKWYNEKKWSLSFDCFVAIMADAMKLCIYFMHISSWKMFTVLWCLTWNKTKNANKLSRVYSTDWKSALNWFFALMFIKSSLNQILIKVKGILI